MKFVVYGTPRPQGSMRAFAHKTTGKVVTVPDNKKTKPWKQQIVEMALVNKVEGRITNYPRGVVLSLTFVLARPKSVSEKKRPCMTVKPDIDKLIRAVMDALTGVAYEDDAEVVRLHVNKEYGSPERAEITVYAN